MKTQGLFFWRHSFCRLILMALLLAPLAVLHSQAAELTLTGPLDYQVVQRSSLGKGLLQITGELSEDVPADATFQVRVVNDNEQTPWLQVNSVKDRKIIASFEAPAGGWWKLEVQVSQGGKQLALSSVPHVGVGEVFVIAGQSNSANHGEEKQTTKSQRVASFDGKAWRIADDPQSGASGRGGSFVPAFADAVVAQENVPVGIIACGIGATSVREWLPKGETFPNPPTLVSRVEQLPDGKWASNGAAYEAFIARMKSAGPQGFRAVLWHQGESDANQKDASRTLSGKLYRDSLEKIIRDSRRDIGFEAPWFVAQASYHGHDDEGSDDIRAAQASLWKDGIALEGPDSDALKGKLRERDGKGVHFSGPGLHEHGARWAAKVLPWLASQSTEPRGVNETHKETAAPATAPFVYDGKPERLKYELPVKPDENVAYGTHRMQAIYFWRAKSDQPTPLLVYIHGGGWNGGDRSVVRNMLMPALDAGISVASVEYRTIKDSTADGLVPPVTGPMFDCARALQFCRSKAKEWNLDKTKVALAGGSAGACTSLWLAFHDDLADATSPDPISRESTRVLCAAVSGAQTTLDPHQMRDWTPNSKYGSHAFGIAWDAKMKISSFQMFYDSRESILPWIKQYSPYELVTPDDPPVGLYYSAPPNLGHDEKDPTHTANFGVKLKEKCDANEVRCDLVYPGAANVKHATDSDYIKAYLRPELK